MSAKTERVAELAGPIVRAQGLSLVDVEYVKEGSNWFLRIFIENRDGEVSIEHCEEVSKLISPELDRLDLFTESYILEISSPGLERPLKTEEDFRRFTGKMVRIKTFAPIDGKKEFTGRLLGLEDNTVSIDTEEGKGVVEIPRDKIARTNLTIDF